MKHIVIILSIILLSTTALAQDTSSKIEDAYTENVFGPKLEDVYYKNYIKKKLN